MPAVVELTKDRIVKVAVKMVNENGWDSVNARSLATRLGVSTKPLYRIYNNMDEIKEDIYKEIFTMEKELTNNLTKDVVRRFRSSQEIFSEVTDEAESDYLSRFAYICMLSFDVYIKKQLIERIIDETLEDPGKK